MSCEFLRSILTRYVGTNTVNGRRYARKYLKKLRECGCPYRKANTKLMNDRRETSLWV